MRPRLAQGLTYAAALAVLAAFLSPIAWMVVISFKTRAQIYAWPPQVIGFTPTLDNYRALFAATSMFPRFLLNSVVVAAGATGLALLVGLPAAYALAGPRIRSAPALRSVVLMVRMLPPVALLLPYYLLFRVTGMLGTLASMAVAHFTFCIAIVVWMMRTTFEAMPAEVEEAGRIDGATAWQVFLHLALPMTKAGIAASAIFAMLTSWNEFLFAVTLSRPDTQTMPVAVAAFVGDVYVSWGQLAAATVVGLLPALLLAFAGQRWLLAGMAPGAVK